MSTTRVAPCIFDAFIGRYFWLQQGRGAYRVGADGSVATKYDGTPSDDEFVALVKESDRAADRA